MNKMILQVIMTELVRKRRLGLIVDKEECSVNSTTENYIVYNDRLKDFYFILDDDTIPPGLNQECVIGGVRIRLIDRIVMINRVH